MMPAFKMPSVSRAGVSPARPTPGGSNIQSVAPPGAAYFDSVLREADVTAVDTWTALSGIGTATPGSVKVPAQAKYLCGMDIVTCFDMGGAVGVRGLSGLRLGGNGLAKGGMYRFLGHAASQTLVTAGGVAFTVPVMHYPLAIPVVGSNDLDVEAIMLGEDCGEFTMVCALHFSDKPSPGGYVDGDLREGDIAAVDVETQLTSIGATASGDPRVPVDKNALAAIVPLIALDAGAAAVTVRLAGAARIGGNGMKLGGSYRFALPGGFVGAVTDGGGAFCNRPEITSVGLPVVPGNTLEIYAIVLGEDPGDVTAAIGLLYQ